MVRREKTLYVIAGPNGAGKSTLTQTRNYEVAVVDPDAIARAINPENPQKAAVAAGKQAATDIRAHLESGRSFAQETTFAGNSTLRLIDRAKRADYRIVLHFIGVNNWKHSRIRVNQRVKKGGHDIPTNDLKRRYGRSFESLKRAIELVDVGRIYDNSEEYRRSIAVIENGRIRSARKSLPEWATAFGIKAPN